MSVKRDFRFAPKFLGIGYWVLGIGTLDIASIPIAGKKPGFWGGKIVLGRKKKA